MQQPKSYFVRLLQTLLYKEHNVPYLRENMAAVHVVSECWTTWQYVRRGGLIGRHRSIVTNLVMQERISDSLSCTNVAVQSLCDTATYSTHTHIHCRFNSLIRGRLDRAGHLTLAVGGQILLQSGEILNPKYYSKFVSFVLRKIIETKCLCYGEDTLGTRLVQFLQHD
jgi:hypothetical protein